MSHDNKNPGLIRRLLARPSPVEHDAADLGTCIGLEFSLDQQALAPPTSPAPTGSMPSWVQRLTGRGKGSS